MNIYQRKILPATMALLTVVSCSACGTTSTPKASNYSVNSVKPNKTNVSSYLEKSSYKDNAGTTWIPIKPALTSLGYRMKDETSNGGYAKIGYSDVMYMLRPYSKQVFSLGKNFTLPEAPEIRNKQIYMTTRSLSKFLQTEVGWNPDSGEIEIATPSEAANQVDSLQGDLKTGISQPMQNGKIKTLSTSVNTDSLVAYAKKYLGVPYEFGAGPYEEKKTFDCSSFTRHVFKKFGVNLPRLAKDQDNVGRRVSRSQLKAGDLIFFTVPGRFKSNAIPGHVGIYIGYGKFIHTWGDPGVQISPLDTGYWSNVTLHMQRIL
ncbi:NlpC/P60 family protein [Paenibacillus sp. sgz500958]|uniref:C40 family peptidase n=1 Tax=Paenibacillus sp. sgz500958 TaxID=3242475 RepID=UPI0036D3090B